MGVKRRKNEWKKWYKIQQHTNIVTYGLNLPKCRFIVKICHNILAKGKYKTDKFKHKLISYKKQVCLDFKGESTLQFS